MAELIAALNAATGGAPASGILLAATLSASIAGLMFWPALIERSLLRPYWLTRRSEYSTLFASAFVHADLGHLLFNTLTFWAFAFPLERVIGSGRLLALYFIGLLASDAGTWLKHRNDPEYRCLGASGAILAVLFASIVYNPRQSILMLPIPVPIPAPLFALGYLAFTYYASRQARGRVNHDAHLSGALAGLAFVLVTDFPAVQRALQGALGWA
jgi:membrane associated rhomboid family serine protease